MAEYHGWYLDISAHPESGILFWMICEDGERRAFRQRFPVAFYATGKHHRLRQFWRYLKRRFPQHLHLSLEHKHDLFAGELEVVRVEIEQPSHLSYIFFQTLRQFPDLDLWHPQSLDAGLATERALACEAAGLENAKITNSEGASVSSDGTDYFVAWHDRRSGVDYDIYGSRVEADGTVVDTAGIAISTAEAFYKLLLMKAAVDHVLLHSHDRGV